MSDVLSAPAMSLAFFLACAAVFLLTHMMQVSAELPEFKLSKYCITHHGCAVWKITTAAHLPFRYRSDTILIQSKQDQTAVLSAL